MRLRHGLSKPVLLLSLAWIVAAGAFQFETLVGVFFPPPVEIRYRSPPQIRFGLGHAPPGASLEQSAESELSRPPDRLFAFPAGTPQAVMAEAIDDWAALGNAVEAKRRDRAPLAAYSDSELARFAEMRGLALDPARGIRDAADWNAVLAEPPDLAEATPFTLDGADLAARALTRRPSPGHAAAHAAAWMLAPPLGLVVLGLFGGGIARRY